MPLPKANGKNSAVKRIMQEAKELADDDSPDYAAAPLDDNLFEWHATIRGAPDTEFEGGLYHLRILLPATYPFSAPDIMLLNPNGRFETNKKICIDGLTSFHAGSWQPAWGVRTAVVGLMSFWNAKGEALQSVGALDYPVDERRRLAKISKDWRCEACGSTCLEMLPLSSTSAEPAASSSSAAAPGPAPPTSAGLLFSDVPNGAPSSPAAVDSASAPAVTSPLPPDAAPAELSSSPVREVASPHHPLSSLAPMPSSPPSPAITFTPLVASPPPPAPSRAAPAPPPVSPLWLDALLGLVISLVVVLLARRCI